MAFEPGDLRRNKENLALLDHNDHKVTSLVDLFYAPKDIVYRPPLLCLHKRVHRRCLAPKGTLEISLPKRRSVHLLLPPKGLGLENQPVAAVVPP